MRRIAACGQQRLLLCRSPLFQSQRLLLCRSSQFHSQRLLLFRDAVKAVASHHVPPNVGESLSAAADAAAARVADAAEPLRASTRGAAENAYESLAAYWDVTDADVDRFSLQRAGVFPPDPSAGGGGLDAAAAAVAALDDVDAGGGFFSAVETFFGTVWDWISPVGLFRGVLVGVHTAAGVPWWAAIALLALAVRAVLLYPHVDYVKNMATMSVHATKVGELQQAKQEARKESDATLRRQKVLRAKRNLHSFARANGFATWKQYTPILIQVPVSGLAFFAVRGAVAEEPGMATGGFGWMADLVSPDPLALQLVAVAVCLVGQARASMRSAPPNRFMHFFWPAVGCGMLVLPAMFGAMSAGVGCYWIVSFAAGWGVTALTRHAPFRRWYGIPDPRVASATPTAATQPGGGGGGGGEGREGARPPAAGEGRAD